MTPDQTPASLPEADTVPWEDGESWIVRVHFHPGDQAPPVGAPGLLGMVGFGGEAGFEAGALPVARIPMPCLGLSPLWEAWYGRLPARYEQADAIHYGHNGEVLFGLLAAPGAEIEKATHQAYRRLIALVRSAGYPHLVRVWNYFPDINGELRGLERYRRFCLGRHRALAETGYAFGADLPAASAIGIEGNRLWIYFLAARRPAVQIENPRQLSAYRYPSRYGPRSPSFSRAMRLEDPATGTKQLFISGTASIVGHETVHQDDVEAQCAETLRNLRAVLAEAGAAPFPRAAGWKVYLRRPGDYPRIRELLEGSWEGELFFLAGDICRRDLLLEIEGVASLQGTREPREGLHCRSPGLG
ncbi:hypothetical protein [Candidatus Methylocalor cossyra]|uniref:Chorismate lyase / 3-hydroxybenzoate synthase n=1 Tax=Candidatus Methylocalor cossyra TaxID=3108543 RepID=A0ABP1C734_9GAMM